MARQKTGLAENTAGFRLLFVDNPLPMWVYDRETLKFLEVNEAAVVQYGFSREEFLAMRIPDIRPPEDIQRLLEDLAKQRPALQSSGEWRHRRKDSQVIDVQIVSHTLEFEGRKAALVVAQDITRRKRAEERTQHQLKRLAALRAIDMTITGSLDLRVTLHVLLEQVTSELSVDAARVLLLNHHTRMLDCTAARSFRTLALQHPHLRLGEGNAGRAALDGRRVAIPNLAEAPGELAQTLLVAGEGFVAYHAAPLAAKGQVNGVLEVFHRGPLTPDLEWFDFLEALAGQASIAIDNATLFTELQRSNVELALAYDTTLEGWSHALDLRDKETEGHSRRVTDLTLQLARAMGVPATDFVHIRRGALLHDIGKMGIPDRILLKPEPLTEEELEIMRRHPLYANELLTPIAYLRPAKDIPYCHHEKWDGTGYPRGLNGEQIPLAARIFAVADVWDALRSDRPYRPAWTEEQAQEYIRDQSGKHFYPRVVEVFLAMDLQSK